VADQLPCAENSQQLTLSCYAVEAVEMWSMVNTTTSVISATIVVQNGNITCAGIGCGVPSGCESFSLSAPSSAVPGFIEAGAHIGQAELDMEGATTDGAQDGNGLTGDYATISAFDGIHTDSRHLSSARKGGVLTAISPPKVAGQMIVGLSTAFHTATSTNNGQTTTFIDQTAVQPVVALHLQFGNGAKNGGLSNSISGQATALRRTFARVASRNATSNLDPDFPFAEALRGRLPVSIDVHGADEIMALLRIHREFPFHLVLQGAAEAFLVADVITESHILAPVFVVLTSRVPPSTFETYRMRDDGLSRLKAAGVQWAIQVGKGIPADNARNLRWEAGWQQVYNGLTTGEALAGITVNVRRAFEAGGEGSRRWVEGVGEIRVGTRANFVVFNGAPLGLESHVQLVALGRDVECRPIQF
jgi:imidazolonepropionase-like amidohydrolase